jgi:DNA end-binding protein Ku
MAGATIWKGFIHFGKTDVAVKLHSAVREERVRFHLLHGTDQVRLRQMMICAYEKQPVPGEEQIKGFEVEDGKYLIVDPEELQEPAPENNRRIEIHEFVKADQVDSIFIDRVYTLEPDQSSPLGKAYGALARTLSDMDVLGICTWTMRKRSYFGALQAAGTVLRLNTLRHADEVVPTASLGLKTVPLAERELTIGSELIVKLSATFEPEKFVNEHERKLQDLIDKKARGEKIAILAPRQLQPTGSNDLLRVLEESLKKAA